LIEKVLKASNQVAYRKLAIAKKRLAVTKNPQRKAALRAQIRAAKKVIALRKQLLKASNPKVKAAIKA